MSAVDPGTRASLHFGATTRDRLARPVILVYWLLLGAGLGLYSLEVGSALPLWIGAITGTVLGHCLALRDLRLWFVAAVIGGTVYLGVMMAPAAIAGPQLWLAFVPAVLCAYASLSDRWSLAACWFPAVIWMLSILDRTHGTTQVDAYGAVLLGGVAIGFVAFLRVRESRRVAMWTRVSATPLAVAKPAALLRETPSWGFLRTGWTLGVSAITFAVTAWVAPQMWKIEAFRHMEQHARRSQGLGVPCCPIGEDVPVTRSRVREYLDLGRGRDDHGSPIDQVDCRVCPRGALPRYVAGLDGSGPPTYQTTTFTSDGGYPPGWSSPNVGGSYSPPATYVHVQQDPPATAPVAAPPRVVPTVTLPPPPPLPPIPTPAPVTPPAPRPAPLANVPPPRPPAPTVATHAPIAPPPPAPPPTALDAPPPPAGSPAAVPPRADSRDSGGTLLHWLATLLAGAVIFQLVSLSLRPLRRAITLRHLRSPLWDETVDQRVSNSWQLALVGLRDGGWRVTAGETPAELARRVKLDELARCATILERARYGIQIDADDLANMSSSADAAYRAARARVSSVARALSWLRWPLT